MCDYLSPKRKSWHAGPIVKLFIGAIYFAVYNVIATIEMPNSKNIQPFSHPYRKRFVYETFVLLFYLHRKAVEFSERKNKFLRTAANLV